MGRGRGESGWKGRVGSKDRVGWERKGQGGRQVVKGLRGMVKGSRKWRMRAVVKGQGGVRHRSGDIEEGLRDVDVMV